MTARGRHGPAPGVEPRAQADRPTPLAGPARGRALGTRRDRFSPAGVWASVAWIIAACAVVGLGIVLASPWVVTAGVAGAAVGSVAAWAFGILNDTR